MDNYYGCFKENMAGEGTAKIWTLEGKAEADIIARNREYNERLVKEIREREKARRKEEREYEKARKAAAKAKRAAKKA